MYAAYLNSDFFFINEGTAHKLIFIFQPDESNDIFV